MGAVALTALGLLAASPRAGAAELAFREVAAEAGLVFLHAPLGDTPGWPMHGGGTVGDFDGDGWPDLFVVGSGTRPDALFLNDRDGTFTDRAAEWGLTDLYRGVGANAADYDGDGDVDLFVTSLGDRPGIRNGQHRLYRNEGNAGFTEVAAEAGVASTGPDFFPDGYGSTWGDFDLDGDLDLWVAGWKGELPLPYVTSRLFRNRGDGTFVDVTEAAGLDDPALRAFGAVFTDMDGDRYPELLVAGDFGTSRYFVNDGAGGFHPEPVGLPPEARVHNGMGTAVADFDRDGRPDWFVTAIDPAWHRDGPPGNRLYLNRSGGGEHRLVALPRSGGVDDGGWGWGVAAADLDNDGRVDLVHTNGWITECPATLGRCYQDDATRLFRNLGDGTFEDVAAETGLIHTAQGRGLLELDYDRDGDLDLVILENAGPLRLFRNDLSGSDANWLHVRLDTTARPALAPHGLGARVEARLPDGTRLLATVDAGSNYLGRGELAVHLGLGEAAEVEALVVSWPDGSETVLEAVAANQHLVVTAAGR